MKKLLFLIPAAALAFTACTSETTEYVGDPQQQAREIAFAPLNQKATRAAGAAEYNAVEGVAYPQNYDMKVVAYSVPETGSAGNYFGSADPDAAPLFMYNYKGGSSGASHGYWAGSTPATAQYWPLSPATINFLAVSNNGSPTADMVSETFNSNYASGVTVTLGNNNPQTAATGTGQHDLMYAFGRAQVTQSGNVLVFPDKVDMEFKHALAWVYFRVKAASTVEASGGAGEITINSITLNGAYYGGTFSAEVTNYDKAVGSGDLAWGTCQWSSPSNTSDNVSPNYTYLGESSSKVLTTSYQNVGDGLLIVPQGSMATPAAAFTSFTINYTLNGNAYDYTYTPTVADRKLLMGKKYIFDITFRLTEIFVNASVENWDESVPTENVEITPVVYANADAGAYSYPTTGTIAAKAGIYTFQVSGLTATGETVTVTEDSPLGDGITAVTSKSISYNTTTKVATVTFQVPASGGSTKTYKLKVTDAGAGGTAYVNTITINQAASD